MTATYDPKKVSVIVSGRQITGFADGTFINVTRDTESFTDNVGSDGEVARTRSNDNRGSIVITLQQISDSNDFLSQLLAADELNGGGVFNVLVRDQLGRAIYQAAEAWIQKPADSEFAREAGSREWTIRCAELIPFVGGN